MCKRMSQYHPDISIETYGIPSGMMMENLIPQMGTAPKQMAERYAEYPATHGHDQHFYYTYEPASEHGHVSSSKHHYSGGGGHKSNAAMSALTLLAFLFFLHILQQCLKDHMTAMSAPQVMIMSAGKEGDENISKISRIKSDKSGITKTEISSADTTEVNKVSDTIDHEHEQFLMKITTSDHGPQSSAQKFQNNYNSNDYKTSFSGFVSAFDKK